jgi:hypothetical protein
MDKLEAFRNWSQSLGGYYDLDNSRTAARIAAKIGSTYFDVDVEMIESQFKDSSITGVKLAYGFVASEKVFAKTMSDKNFDYIAISIGSITSLIDVFSRVVRDSDILFSLKSDISEVSTVDYPVDKLAGLSDLGPISGLSLASTQRIIHCVGLCVRFMLHHELAHLWFGHLPSTVGYDDPDELSTIKKSLEFDADYRACCGFLLGYIPAFSEKRFDESGTEYRKHHFFSYSRLSVFSEYNETIEISIHTMVVSIYIMMRYHSSIFNLDAEGKFHPSWANRISWFIVNCGLILGRSSNQIPQTILRIIKSATVLAEKAFTNTVSGEQFDVFSDYNIENANNSVFIRP